MKLSIQTIRWLREKEKKKRITVNFLPKLGNMCKKFAFKLQSRSHVKINIVYNCIIYTFPHEQTREGQYVFILDVTNSLKVNRFEFRRDRKLALE